MVQLRKLGTLGLLYTTLTSVSGFAPSVSSRTLVVPQTRNSVISSNRYLPTASTSALFSQEENSVVDEDLDDLITDTALTLRRVNWVSWWSQMILSVVSTVTLLFAKSVVTVSSNKSSITGGFFFAGSGIALSFLSIIWTWGGARLAKRLGRTAYSRIKAANMIRRTITIGSVLNLSGMFLALIGAQQIVGLLASKLLTMQGVTPFAMTAAGVSAQTLQPLDILIVQANTNTLLSHFISLICGLVMTRGIDKLDPPSVEDDPR